LGCQVTANLDLRNLGHPHLEALHEATHHTAHLPSATATSASTSTRSKPGLLASNCYSKWGTLPASLHAMGKALLAFALQEDRERFLTRPLEAITSKTIIDPGQAPG